MLANDDTRQHCGPRTYPNVVADSHGLANVLPQSDRGRRVLLDIVILRVKHHSRAHENPLLENHASASVDETIAVYADVISYLDLPRILSPESFGKEDIDAAGTETIHRPTQEATHAARYGAHERLHPALDLPTQRPSRALPPGRSIRHTMREVSVSVFRFHRRPSLWQNRSCRRDDSYPRVYPLYCTAPCFGQTHIRAHRWQWQHTVVAQPFLLVSLMCAGVLSALLLTNLSMEAVRVEPVETEDIEASIGRFNRWGLVLAGILTAFAFAAFVWMSRSQSYVADDFSMQLGARTSALGDYLLRMYRGLNGRVVPTFYAYVFLPRPRLFAVLNGVCLFGSVLMIIRLGLDRWPRLKSHDALLALAVLGTFWFGAPHPQQTLMWRVGAFNYLWVLFPMLLFALPYRVWLSDSVSQQPWKSTLVRSALMFLAGLFVGLMHAQAIVLLGWLGLWLLVYVIRRRMIAQVPAWLYTGSIGFLIGAATLLTAPGNQARMNTRALTAAQHLDTLRSLLSQAFINDWAGTYPWLGLILLLGLGVTALRQQSGSRVSGAAAWFTGAALLLVPLYWSAWATNSRATFFSFAALLIALLCLIPASRHVPVYKALTASSAVLGCLLIATLLATDALLEIQATREMERYHHSRTSVLLSAQGTEQDIVLDPIPFEGRRFQMIGEISADPDHWYNKDVASYYGVASVRLKE